MQAIVSALDEPYREMVGDIWGGLKAVAGLKQLSGAIDPHFTYHTAERYDGAAAERVLARIAAATRPFTVTTGGIGVLRGQRHVLYLPVLANDALAALHEAVWRELAPSATGVRDAYAPATWAPHITLAAGRIDEAQMSAVLRFLEGRDARWELPVTNLCLVANAAAGAEGWRRFPLAGAG